MKKKDSPPTSLKLSPSSPAKLLHGSFHEIPTEEPSSSSSSDPDGQGDINDDDEDESDLSDEESETPNACDEPMPKVPVYDQSLQRGLIDVKMQLAQLASTIQSTETNIDTDSGLLELLPEVESLSKFQSPESCTVGFIGTSGEEFRYVNEVHPGPYSIEAIFMSPEEVTELLEELLRSFRVYYCGSSSKELSTEEQRGLRDAANSAEATLESLFGSQMEFNEEFLRDESEGAEVYILTRLEEWADLVVSLRPSGTDALVYTTVAKNLRRCTETLDHLVADTYEDGKPALWPFIKLLRVYLKAPILRLGLVIADLPGFRDLNYARVRATEKYLLRNCDEVFIVSDIARCCTDKSIPDIMKRCENKPRHIVIFADEESRGDGSEAQKVRKMVKNLRRVQVDLEKARKCSRKTKFSQKGDSKAMQLMDKVDDLQIKLKGFMVGNRNRRVRYELQQKYKFAKVFCVSNTWYATHRKGEERLSEDYIKLSGIHDLRGHCQLVPAEAQLRSTVAYLHHQVPALLGSLRQWALAGADFVTEYRAVSLRATLKQVEAIIRKKLVSAHGCIENVKHKLIDLFEKNVLRKIVENEEEWTKKSVKNSDDWANLHHVTFGAICRHNGKWTTRRQESISVNEELTKYPKEILAPKWDFLCEWLNSQADKLAIINAEIFEEVCAALRVHEPHAPQAVGNVLDCMKDRKDNICFAIRQNIREMTFSSDTVKWAMVSGIDSSFMATIMRPVYLSCSKHTGQGCDKRRKDEMREFLMSSKMFLKYHHLAKRKYFKEINKRFNDFQKDMLEEVEKIVRDLNMVVADEGEVLEAIQKPTLAGMVKAGVDTAQATLSRAQFDLGLAMGDKRD
ncbi:hypothetical protein N7466_010173 [Penicillium verhagenii]|uniref:uncharacterized protein n=1 Tax=Penicillium verhagenii TaxID=1562060 RepID=UPI002545642A|nr:uncharacterized protein N7466_010173 [Penicillium verhagenii]KAJ5919230.1 hypothetical protein N7466_010173 [Penicillium verhagenii]